MYINYWDCEFRNAEDKNFGTEEDPDYGWRYYCLHPKGSDLCDLDNKYGGEKADCVLLDKKNIECKVCGNTDKHETWCSAGHGSVNP